MTGLLSLAGSQLLIVDVQERLAPAMANLTEATRNIEMLARAAVRLEAPITISEQYPKGLGSSLPSILDAAGSGAAVLAKTHFSCARDGALLDRIGGLDRRQVVVCGIEAHVCVLQTAMDLKARGFDPAVVTDATTSRREESKAVALGRMAAAGVDLITTEMAIFEWLEQSGTPQFKSLAPLLR